MSESKVDSLYALASLLLFPEKRKCWLLSLCDPMDEDPLSMRFSRQEYWSGLPFPSPGDLPNPEIKPGSPVLQADSLPSEPQGSPYSPALTKMKPGICFSFPHVISSPSHCQKFLI